MSSGEDIRWDRISPLYDRMRCKSRWGPLQRRRRVSVRERAVDNLRGADDDVATTCKPCWRNGGARLGPRQAKTATAAHGPPTLALDGAPLSVPVHFHTPCMQMPHSEHRMPELRHGLRTRQNSRRRAIAMHSFPGIALLDVQTLFKPNFSLAQQTRRCLYFFQRPCP